MAIEKDMSDPELVDTIKKTMEPAGKWFIAEYYMAALMWDRNVPLWKDALAAWIWTQHPEIDVSTIGTRRLNALFKIIDNNWGIKAMEIISVSKRIEREHPEAIIIAKNNLKILQLLEYQKPMEVK